MTANDHPTDLLAVHALDALDSEEERSLVERHVASCPRCRQELDAMRGVAGALGNTVAPPPERLWSEISSRLGTDGGGADARDAEVIVLPTGRPRSTVSRRARRGTRTFAAVCAAAAVIIALLAVSLVRSNDKVTSYQHAFGSPGRASVAAALAAPGHRLVVARTIGGARLAEFVLLPSGAGYLVRDQLASAPPGRTYELWAIVNGTPIPIGLMGATPTQVGFTMASTPRPSALAITLEPATGSLRPTTSPVGIAPV